MSTGETAELNEQKSASVDCEVIKPGQNHNHNNNNTTMWETIVFVCLLLAVNFIDVTQAAGVVTATGGGVLLPGQDLELTNTLDKEWDLCYWFW